MPRKPSKSPRKTWAEKWGEQELDFSISTPELRKLTRKVANLTARRLSSIERQGYFSYAGDKLREELSKREKPINKMNRFELSALIADYHHFWQAKTSTVRGAREELASQSGRIFGRDARGRPTRIMTRAEASAVWALKDEFERVYHDTARYDSNRIQAVIGEVMIQRGNVNFADQNVMDYLDTVRTRLEEDYLREEEEYARKVREMDEVFHGGDDFDF